MTLKLQLILIVIVIFFFIMITRLIKRNELELRYTIIWFVTGFILLLIGVFPSLMDWFVRLIGVYSVANGLFAMALFFILIMLLSITAIVSKLSKSNKELTQKCALLEKEIKKINSGEQE